MKKKVLPTKSLICISLLGLFACSSNQNEFVIDDADGALGTTNAPFSVEMKLNKYQATAAREGRLGLIDEARRKRGKGIDPGSTGKC